jgi:hypothetical protein
MGDGEDEWVRRFSGLQVLLGSVVLAIAGVAPLQLYGIFGPPDGNPIGLGLLMIVAVPLAGFGIVLGLAKMLIEFLVRRD